jgi:DNA-binding NarL/FixJ family response regulator
MTGSPTVDVIDDLLALGPALQAAIAFGRGPIALRVIAASWTQYAARIDSVADVVALRAELADHVPTALKVRALRAAGARPVVIADDPADVHRARLIRCGAAAVLTRRDDLDDVLNAILDERAHPEPSSDAPGLRDVHLSDRQLQIACLFAGHGAPSSKWIAQLLGLPESSVRTNIQRARRALGAADREELRARLIEDGWMAAS